MGKHSRNDSTPYFRYKGNIVLHLTCGNISKHRMHTFGGLPDDLLLYYTCRLFTDFPAAR